MKSSDSIADEVRAAREAIANASDDNLEKVIGQFVISRRRSATVCGCGRAGR